MDLIGIDNEAEFFPSGTLSDVLKEELQDITARWGGLDRAAHPVERLARVAGPTVEVLRQVRNSSDRSRRVELVRDAHHDVLTALGYAWRREGAYTALDAAPVIPLVSRAADATGRDALWVIEAPIPDPEDEASDPLGACFTEDQLPPDMREAALLNRTIESILAEGVFELPDGPRHVLVLGLSQLVLIDKQKWPARSALRFDLQEIFTRVDRDTLTVMACLIAREARVPDQGAPISDRLEEEAQRNANAVTTSLKRTVRDAIELLGQEVIAVTGGKYPSKFPDPGRRGVWIDGPELSRECLRYMYRLLFLFYAEANPRLNLLDMRNPIYASGYSLEALRELESVPLRTTADREGTFLWESLQRTLDLLYTGLDLADEERGTGLRLPAVKVSLLDPESTPLLAGGDELPDPDLIGDVREHRAQAALVAPVRRRGDAVDPAHGIALERGVDDAPIAVGGRVMRLVDDQEVECGQLVEIAGARQRRHHREGDLAVPGLLLGVDHRGRDPGIYPPELAAILSGQLVAVGEHAGLGARALRGLADHAPDDAREHDRLARAGRGDAKGVSVFAERADATLDELLLTGAQQHGMPLTVPRTGARPAAGSRTGKAGPAAAAPTPRPFFGSSTRCCRARSSIPTAATFDDGWANSQTCRPDSSTNLGKHRNLCYALQG
jgi:hypothetical protein